MSRQSDKWIYAPPTGPTLDLRAKGKPLYQWTPYPTEKHIIGDFNREGYDSVESESFDPGFGCIPVLVERVIAPPPPVPDNRTEWQREVDRKNMAILRMTDAENDRQQDEYLKRHGIF